jgi:molybdopterin synthase sulfur carrier subunit
LKIKYFATYRDITRRVDDEMRAPPDVWALLAHLGERYGARFKENTFTPDGMGLGEETIILVNGRNIHHMDGVKTVLGESDVISIFPLVAGG